MKKSILSCAALCLLLIPSCKKKEDEPARRDLLVAGKWQVTASKTHITLGSVTNTTDNFATYKACEKDDFTIFRSDNHLIDDEGATKCTAGAPQQTDNGIWSLTENDTKLLVADGGLSETFKINSLNNSTLELEYTDVDSATSASYRQVVTFSHVN